MAPWPPRARCEIAGVSVDEVDRRPDLKVVTKLALLGQKYKAMTDKTEAAEEMFTQQVTAKEYAHVLRTREYKKILDEAGQVDFIPHVLKAVCEGHIPPDHIWYKYNRFAWHNCTLSCMCARMPACIHAGMHASAFDSARRL